MIWLLIGCIGTAKNTSEDTSSAEEEYRCSPASELWSPFPLAEGDALTQIHADVAAVEDEIWLVYNLPDEQGLFKTYMRVIDCTGQELFPAARLSDSSANETYPRIAISGDVVVVIWQADSGSGENNLSMSYVAQTRQGDILSAGDWNPIIEGETVIANHWMPAISPAVDGFWVVGSFGRENRFQSVLQHWDLSGNPTADARWVGGSDAEGLYPSVASHEDVVLVAWEQDGGVWSNVGTKTELQEPILVTAAGGAPRALFDSGEPVVLHHQIGSQYDVFLAQQQISDGVNNHTPNGAVGDSGVGMVYYQLQSGTQNDLWFSSTETQPFLLQDTPPAAPYRPAISHVGNDVFLIVWSQGISPEFELWGQFVSLF